MRTEVTIKGETCSIKIDERPPGEWVASGEFRGEHILFAADTREKVEAGWREQAEAIS